MPQLLTAPIFTTFAAGAATSYSVGSILAYAAVSMVTSWALQALAPTPSTGGQGLTQNGLGASQPHEYVYGRVRKGGTITYMESTGDKNKFLHMILCLAGHEIDAVEAIYIDDEVVTLDASNFVTTSKWTRDGTPKIRILSQLGSDTQTVNATLLAESNQITSNFRGQGIAYLYIRLEYDKKVFQNGIPTFTARIRGKKVYNPSTGTTAWSANSALCIRDYLTSAIGLADPLVDDVFFNAARADCVVQVPIVGGTQNRYETHGVLSAANSIGDNLNKLLTSCAGTLFWGTGGWKLKVGAWSSPVKTFTLSNLRSDINLRTRNPMRDNFNSVQGTFNDAGQDYIAADYPPYVSATFKTEDAGFDAPLDLELPLTTNSAMAQRLAKLTLLRAREQMSFEAEFDLSAMGVQVGDNVLLDLDRYGWGGANAKPFEVMAWRFVVDSNTGEIKIALTLKETSSDAFDWNAEDISILSNNTALVDPNADMALTSFTVFNGVKQQKDGSWASFISLSWEAPLNLFVDSYAVEWRISGSGDNFQTATTVNQNYKISPVVDGVTYEVRVAAINDGGFVGPYSTTTTVIGGDTTAPGLPTGLSATGGYQNITLRWTKPTAVDFKHVEIYENTSNTTTGATLISTSAGNSFVRNNLANQVTRWYFFKSVDFSGNKSAFTSGVSATTSQIARSDLVDGASGVRVVTSTSTPGQYDGEVALIGTRLYLWNASTSAWETELFTQVEPSTLDVTRFASGIRPVEIVSSLPTTGNVQGRTVFLTTDNKLYRWNGSAYVASVPTSDLTGTLAATQFAQTLRPVEVVGTLPTTGNFQGRTVFLTTDNKLYRYTGSAWVSTVPAADIAGQLVGSQIADLAITTAKFAAGLQPVEIVSSLPTSGNFQGRTVFLTTDNKLYRYTGSAWTKATDGADITANSITAGQIQAGAISTDELAAGAITTEKLAVGSSNNTVHNSQFYGALSGWNATNNSGNTGVMSIRAAGSSWTKPGCPVLQVFQPDGGTTGYVDVRNQRVGETGNASFGTPVKEGSTWEASAYTSAHRCIVELRIEWRNVSGTTLGYSPVSTNSNDFGSSTDPDQWLRLVSRGIAPAGAAYAVFHIRKRATNSGASQPDSFMMVHKPLLGETVPNASVAMEWSPGGWTLISGDAILTGSVNADRIVAGSIKATQIDAGAITAVKLDANSVIAGKIEAGAVNSREIAAGAITTTKLSIGDTSNMVPNDWSTGNLDGWVVSFIDEFILDSGTGSNAGWRLKTRSRDVSPSTFVPVSGGEQYYLSAWVYNTDTVRANLILHLQTQNGATNTYPIAAFTDAKNTWVFLEGTVLIPAGYTKAKVILQTDRTDGVGTSTYWTKPVMRRAAAGKLIVDGSIQANHLDADSVTAGKIAAGAVNAREIAAGAITAEKMAVAAGNSCYDFDCAVEDYWSNPTARDLVAAGDTFRALGVGRNYLRIPYSASTTVDTDSISDWFIVEPDTYYYAEAMSSMSAGGGTGARVIVEFARVNDNGSLTYTRSVNLGTNTTSTWTKYTSDATTALKNALKTAADESRMRFKFRRLGDSVAVNARFASPKVIRRNAGSLVVDGTIQANHLDAVNAVITGTAQIADLVVGRVKIARGGSLSDQTFAIKATATSISSYSTPILVAEQVHRPSTSATGIIDDFPERLFAICSVDVSGLTITTPASTNNTMKLLWEVDLYKRPIGSTGTGTLIGSTSLELHNVYYQFASGLNIPFSCTTSGKVTFSVIASGTDLVDQELVFRHYGTKTRSTTDGTLTASFINAYSAVNYQYR